MCRLFWVRGMSSDARPDDPNRLGTILRLALGGDRGALNVLLARLRPYLHLLVRQHLESDAHHRRDGSDLVQETLMRLHRGLDPGNRADPAHFRGQGVPELLGWVGMISFGAISPKVPS